MKSLCYQNPSQDSFLEFLINASVVYAMMLQNTGAIYNREIKRLISEPIRLFPKILPWDHQLLPSSVYKPLAPLH